MAYEDEEEMPKSSWKAKLLLVVVAGLFIWGLVSGLGAAFGALFG